MFARQPLSRHGVRISQSIWRSSQCASRRSFATAQETASKPSLLRRSARVAFYGVVFSTVGAVSTWSFMTRNGMGFLSDEESLGLYATVDEEARITEQTIDQHPYVAQLRARPDLTESRPHMKMPAAYRARSLTGSALAGPRKLVVPPRIWLDEQGKEFVSIAYVGDDLCGHPGIVHGGFLATMLDEGLARCSMQVLPYKIAVTANLNIDYRKPTPANSYLVLKARTTKVEGRKAWVEGHIELLTKPGEKPVVLAEAKALFVSPRQAAMMPKILQ